MRKISDQTVKSVKALRIVVMEVENNSVTVENQEEMSQVQLLQLPFKPDIQFNGKKIDLIRVLLSLCRLDCFVDSEGHRVPDCKVFQAFGQLLGIDLTLYLKALDRTKQECTSMETQTAIFREMEEAIRKYFEMY